MVISWQRPAHQKTSLLTRCKNLSSIFAPYLVCTIYYKLEFANFMYKVVNNNISTIYEDKFIQLDEIHNYKTRQKKNSIFYLPRVRTNLGQNLLAFRGTKI